MTTETQKLLGMLTEEARTLVVLVESRAASGRPIVVPPEEQANVGKAIRGFLAAIGSLAAERDRLIAAAELVLWHRVGTQPMQGWLKDTDHSRDTLTNLAAVVAQVKGEGAK